MIKDVIIHKTPLENRSEQSEDWASGARDALLTPATKAREPSRI